MEELEAELRAEAFSARGIHIAEEAMDARRIGMKALKIARHDLVPAFAVLAGIGSCCHQVWQTVSPANIRSEEFFCSMVQGSVCLRKKMRQAICVDLDRKQKCAKGDLFRCGIDSYWQNTTENG